MLIFKKKSKDLAHAIPFMKWRYPMLLLSGILIVLSLSTYTIHGMNFGIDFLGGTLIEVENQVEEPDLGQIRAILADEIFGDYTVQTFGDPKDILIRIGETESDAGTDDIAQSILELLGSDYQLRRVERVGPSVSNELYTTSMIALVVSSLGILFYLWMRFEWQFAVGAIITTIHDVVLTVGLYSLAGLDFNLSSIAALLTIIGYSLNDTVVIYDRIRETLRRYKKAALPNVIDSALTQTLSRTLRTSITTLLALLAMVIFGGEVLRSFTIAMIFGVVVGTYSSLFIASPILIFLGLRSNKADKSDSSLETSI